MTKVLEVIKDQPVAVAHTGYDIESLFRFALEKGASVEALERLMVIRRELNAENAKKAFDTALAAFQSECPIIERRKQVMNKGGNGIRYKYAPLDDIVIQVRDLLQKHGFSFSLDTAVEIGWVKAICKLTHKCGHSQLSEFKVPVDKDAFMNEQQKFASALTFAKRYAFCNSLGILTGDDDTDSRTEREKPKGPSTLAAEPSVKDLATELWVLLKPVRGDKPTWEKGNEFLWRHEILDAAADESAPQLSAKRFKEVIEAVKLKQPLA